MNRNQGYFSWKKPPPPEPFEPFKVVAIGFPEPPPQREKSPTVDDVPRLEPEDKIQDWLLDIPSNSSNLSPPPNPPIDTSDELKQKRKAEDASYRQGTDTGESSWTNSTKGPNPWDVETEVGNERKLSRSMKPSRESSDPSVGSDSSRAHLSTGPPREIFKPLERSIPGTDSWSKPRALPKCGEWQDSDDHRQQQTAEKENRRRWSPEVNWEESKPLQVNPNAEKKDTSFEWPKARRFSVDYIDKKSEEQQVEADSATNDMQQLETHMEEMNTSNVGPDNTQWSDPEITETEPAEPRPEVSNVVSTLPEAGQWPDPQKVPRLVIPKNYDDDPVVAKTLSNVHRKFRRRDGEEDESWHGNPLASELAHDPDVSIEVGDMDSDDNKFEVSELIEYKDLSWCIAMPIEKEKTNNKNIQQHLVYSYQMGIDRLFLTTEQSAELKNTLLIKYKRVDNKVEVVPIYSALPSTGLLSVKYRHNKGIEVRVYGIVNFVDFSKDADHSQRLTMVWTDALGPLYLTAADRSNFRRKLMGSEDKIFAPLRMCMMTVKGEFTLTVANGYVPKWSILSFNPLIEEGPKDPNIGRNLWPARIIRFDDLVLRKQKNGCSWLRSYSNPDVNVFAGANLSGILQSAGPTYTQKGVMMGFVVPVFMKNEFAHYEALIVGPPRVVMALTEGRFLNYCPKTWEPKIEKICQKFREEHNLKEFAREEPSWKPPHESSRQMKSMQGFHEFHFDFHTYQ